MEAADVSLLLFNFIIKDRWSKILNVLKQYYFYYWCLFCPNLLYFTSFC